jgi:hypothetical protein
VEPRCSAAPGLEETRPGAVHLYFRRGFLGWVPGRTLTNPIPYDGEQRSFGDAVDIQAGRLLASGSTVYPFAAYVPMIYLYEFGAEGFRPVALLDAAAARSVKLSRGSALVDVRGVRFGTVPQVFELPPR